MVARNIIYSFCFLCLCLQLANGSGLMPGSDAEVKSQATLSGCPSKELCISSRLYNTDIYLRLDAETLTQAADCSVLMPDAVLLSHPSAGHEILSYKCLVTTMLLSLVVIFKWDV